MSIINETWDDGKSYRVKRADGGWDRKSFLHKAKDLLFGDGNDLANNAENNLGAIKGLTKSTNVTEEGYAVDATALAEINSKISELNTEMSNMRYPMPEGIEIKHGTLGNGKSFTWTATEDCYVTGSFWTNGGNASYATLNGVRMVGWNDNGSTTQGWLYGSFFARKGSTVKIFSNGNNISEYRIFKVQ